MKITKKAIQIAITKLTTSSRPSNWWDDRASGRYGVLPDSEEMLYLAEHAAEASRQAIAHRLERLGEIIQAAEIVSDKSMATHNSNALCNMAVDHDYLPPAALEMRTRFPAGSDVREQLRGGSAPYFA